MFSCSCIEKEELREHIGVDSVRKNGKEKKRNSSTPAENVPKCNRNHFFFTPPGVIKASFPGSYTYVYTSTHALPLSPANNEGIGIKLNTGEQRTEKRGRRTDDGGRGTDDRGRRMEDGRRRTGDGERTTEDGEEAPHASRVSHPLRGEGVMHWRGCLCFRLRM